MSAYCVLLVEDNAADARLTEMAMRESTPGVDFRWVQDGEEALAFLRRESGYKDVPRPDLVLLDLNMPRKDGRQTLRDVKSDESLRDIPILVLTTSASETDIEECYRHHANAYVVKPLGLDELIGTFSRICNFWFHDVAVLPRRKR